ncbi:hypothetical protein HNY73_005055 [Argiope bruennichi]|uniref:Uncharacterized protein n=1 Tax=Argiope bruennichi TaxID=94029 RepID=A0A8T0FG67_ARGBR|nr:hypothetical protein HNY73_005055 [Argiope bruennichi]
MPQVDWEGRPCVHGIDISHLFPAVNCERFPPAADSYGEKVRFLSRETSAKSREPDYGHRPLSRPVAFCALLSSLCVSTQNVRAAALAVFSFALYACSALRCRHYCCGVFVCQWIATGESAIECGRGGSVFVAGAIPPRNQMEVWQVLGVRQPPI